MKNLALIYRPKTLDEMIGQHHLLKEGVSLRRMIEENTLLHTFLYGPPGCGKTTLARIIATTLGYPFYELNATTFKTEEIQKIFKTYTNALQKPLIFIDEVHRLNKNQQEVLLPFMERYDALIVGASTENPYYSMTAAIRSRSHLFKLEAVSKEEMRTYLETILKRENIESDEEANAYLVFSSGGDIRAMLNLLESAATVQTPITLEILKQIRPHAIQMGSSESESHYELTSAMIKSIRGSDIDAALYYLAQLIEGGEPAEFIARRLAILASEDVGNANPHALNLASSTLNIVKHIGYPEARISLSQLVIYLASSPKSNSAYMAINKAQKAIQEGLVCPIPDHIKTHAKNYYYPHDFGGWVAQEYLKTPLRFYKTQKIGFEKTLWEWHKQITTKSN
ncbi:MAG: replication-associated recombination protein A [Sulfurovum sp.]|nr:replication-associated recombination protein A [Sulfurovum sp.]MCB4760654.1 replication-associated recombination protein A [Sulfurovum sp.]MCB4772022.1 replication-associated recombination protein A [Sulfurovum sp.]MCB4782498.1 replication-associated recombination protein A [Sulfurovum sp.]